MLGSRNFIPGFEEGLTGAKAGEEREVEATFPGRLSGGEARRQDRALRRQGQGGGEPETPDASTRTSPRRLGVESVEKLREMVKQRLEQDRAWRPRGSS